jgi:hypothetical protein
MGLAVLLWTLPAHAVPGSVLDSFTVPAAARCGGEASSSGPAVAVVQGSKVGFEQIPVMVVTSCVQNGQAKLFFIDPSDPAADGAPVLKKTIVTSVNPADGWQSLVYRSDKTDLLACTNVGEAGDFYAIDISSLNTVADGTATFLFNASNADCTGVAWDTGDKTIFLTQDTGNIVHVSETGAAIGAAIDPGCAGALGGISVAGSTLLVSCAEAGPVCELCDPTPAEIRQIPKTGGAAILTVEAPTAVPADLECDPSFAASFRDALWVKTDTSNSLSAVELPFGTCSIGKGPQLCAGGTSPDTDGDGLLDCWETAGITIDGVTYQLAGANPNRKDVYIELDYMQHHHPDLTAVQQVIAAFAAAPVQNPDGSTGITLHVDIGEQLPHKSSLVLVPCTAPHAVDADTADFDQLKAANFGTAAERAAGTTLHKSFAYHYGIFAHNLYGAGTTSGCSEVHGNDFVVTLGSWARRTNPYPVLDTEVHNIGSIIEQAGTLMHEAGHNFDLRHGGLDNINCKPNYPSVMSYSRQMTAGMLDYSPADLPDLNESTLNENFGVGINLYTGSVVFGPPYLLRPTTVLAGGSINWNRNRVSTDSTVRQDLTNFGVAGCGTSANQTLKGFDDWENLRLNFASAIDFAGGSHGSAEEAVEITVEAAAAVTATIKVKPAERSFPVYVGPRELIKVVIYGYQGFDATAVDTSNAKLLGITVGTGQSWEVLAYRDSKGVACDVLDHNRDGFLDKVCRFDFKNVVVPPGLATVTLEAGDFQGVDAIFMRER